MPNLHYRRYHDPLVLRSLPRRQRSLAAAWALRFAVFAPVLLIIAVLAFRADYIDVEVLSVLCGIVLAVALIGVILIGAALHSLWSNGTRGGRQAIGAIFLSIPTLAPFVTAGALWLSLPKQADVSTDLVAPPLFARETRLADTNASAIVAAGLRDGYPELTGRRYRAAPDAIEATMLAVAESFGWQLVSRRGRVGANDELYFEFSNRVPVIGMPGQALLRITDEGDTSYVDFRARLPRVPHDLGWNAMLADRYLQTLDYELVGIAEAEGL